MAIDIFSIPGMSAEVEALVSSTKFMILAARCELNGESIDAVEREKLSKSRHYRGGITLTICRLV